MFCLYSMTHITIVNELSNFMFHASPPEGLLQILIHFGTSWMYREKGIMGFIHDNFPELPFRNDKALLDEQGISVINTEALIFPNALCKPILTFFTITSRS